MFGIPSDLVGQDATAYWQCRMAQLITTFLLSYTDFNAMKDAKDFQASVTVLDSDKHMFLIGADILFHMFELDITTVEDPEPMRLK